MITANSSLGVSGATYAANQLVLYKHIYKKAETYKLTISNLNAFLSAMGYDAEEGYWELCPAGHRYNGGSYPTSYLQYNGNNYIQGTQAQWTAFFNVVYDKDYWDNLNLLNSETNDTFCLNEYCETSVITTVFTNLKNGSNQTISLRAPSTPTSAVIDLNGEWTTGSTNPVSTSYYSFESRESKGTANSGDYIYLKIKGYTTYTLYIRSNGESNWDYVMVSKPDVSITYSTSYNSTNVYAHTRGEATAGTDLPNYKEVTFTGLTTAEHTITIVYRKDSSGDSGTDAGYVLIPKANASYINMYSPSTTYSKNIVFGFYDAVLVKEIDMDVTVTIYSNNGQTYTQTCNIIGGKNNKAYANRFYTGCTIPIQYTGSRPTNITYKYTITDRSTAEECCFDFTQYYDGIRSADRKGCFISENTVKESDGTNYVATEIPFDSGFFAASDARLELYFYNR